MKGETWALIFVGVAAFLLVIAATNAAVEKRAREEAVHDRFVAFSGILNDHHERINTVTNDAARAQITADNALITAKQALTKASEKENVVRYEANAYCLITHNDTHANLGCRKW